MKSRLAILFFAFVAAYIVFNTELYKKNMYQWDASGYYLYLPAVFIYHDLAHFSFYKEVNHKYNLSGESNDYALYNTPTGRLNDKYAIGTAVFQLPFFLMAHAYCTLAHAPPADGYSKPYQLAGIFSTIFWVAAGLFLLRAFLRRTFSDNITAATLLCIGFGTNIYCYTVFAPGMSHPYGFFLFAGVLYATDSLYRYDRIRYAILLGVLLGLTIITRPVNIVVAVLPLLWNVYDIPSLRERLQWLSNRTGYFAAALLAATIVVLPQLAYWKYSTGSWLYYSYKDEHFSFLRPHIINGLFSYQKGWFVYTPLVFVALTGLYYTWKRNRKIVPSIVLFFAVMLYVVFSWRGWWYGGSFSARAMIESLPVVAIPLAYMLQRFFELSRSIVLKIAFSVVLLFLVALNMFQSYQYSTYVIHYVLMNKAYYWRSFGKLHVTQEDAATMMTWDEYFNENVETGANQKD